MYKCFIQTIMINYFLLYQKNEEIIINVLITLITILISIILYFILIGCYNEMGSNICLKNNYIIGLIIFLFL